MGYQLTMKNKELKKIPGDSPSIFPWGDAIAFFKNYDAYSLKKFKKYGKVYKIRFLKRDIAVLLKKMLLMI